MLSGKLLSESQQAWFIKNFGANVNLGNISPHEIIPLESLRLGLREIPLSVSSRGNETVNKKFVFIQLIK